MTIMTIMTIMIMTSELALASDSVFRLRFSVIADIWRLPSYYIINLFLV